jgi:antitoxin (DNA-binding transcriptional repressor) of toxin-antitoxin stability system
MAFTLTNENRMPDRISIDDAHDRLRELIAGLRPGVELVITEDDERIAKLIAEPKKPTGFRQPGLGRGMISIVGDDEEHLDDFAVIWSKLLA